MNVFVSANVGEFLLCALKPLGVARGARFFGVSGRKFKYRALKLLEFPEFHLLNDREIRLPQ